MHTAEQQAILSPLGGELLRNYVAQFAENQRSREQSFLKIVGFFGGVIAAYAYVYKEHPTDLTLLSLVTIVAVVLLLFGALTVTVIAYSYRRQQYIVARINEHAGIVGPDRPLPPDHGPDDIAKRRIGRFFWMPDIFLVYYLVFPVFQLIIGVAYFARVATWGQAWPLIAGCVGAVVASVAVPGWYGRKLRKKMQTDSSYNVHPERPS